MQRSALMLCCVFQLMCCFCADIGGIGQVEELRRKLEAASAEKRVKEADINAIRTRMETARARQAEEEARLNSAYEAVERTCNLRRAELGNALAIEHHLTAALAQRPEVVCHLDPKLQQAARYLQQQYNCDGQEQVLNVSSPRAKPGHFATRLNRNSVNPHLL